MNEAERDQIIDDIDNLGAYEAAVKEIGRLTAEVHGWKDSAAQFHRNQLYYRGLLVETGQAIGKPAYTQDDGGQVDEPLVAKVPESVRDLVTEVERLREACRYCLEMLEQQAGEGGEKLAQRLAGVGGLYARTLLRKALGEDNREESRGDLH